MSIGGRFGYDDDGETPNTHIAFFAYDTAPIIYETRGLGRTAGDMVVDAFRAVGRDNLVMRSGRESRSPTTGVLVECEHGYVDLTGSVAFDAAGKEVKRFRGPGAGPQANFIKAVRSRKLGDLKTDILEGHLSTSLCHMGNTSHRVGAATSPGELRERLQGDKAALETFERFQAHLAANEVDLAKTRAVLGPWLSMESKKERFHGAFADRANALLKRDYRKPFVIPENV
jgi:hypothetical protein